MSYTPNFKNPKVFNTCKKALTFVELYTRTTRVDSIAVTQLYKHFGNTSRPLGEWLVDKLLVVADPYYNFQTGRCKKYRQNADGVKMLRELLGNPTADLTTECQQQLDTGNFEYEEKSDRLFNPIQFLRKTQRDDLLASNGYRNYYDIEAAAPTMLLQRAKQLDPNFTAPALEHYITNRSEVRQQVAKQCEITQGNTKFIFNAMLQGAAISSYSESKIFQELNYNYDAIHRLKHNQQVQAIKQDISRMWRVLKSEFPKRVVVDSLGRTRSARLSGKQKSGYYRELENQVGKVIRRELVKQKIKCFWIHDGWYCNEWVDSVRLCARVKQQLGFVIKLDWTIYEN